jgi:hypothetical protein
VTEDQRPGDQRHKPYHAPPTTPLTYRDPSNPDQDRAKSNYDSYREWIRLGIEILAFLFLVRYVHWTKVQSLATEAAANAAKQSADTVARQVADEEAVERASVVFFSTRIENFPIKPILKFTLKNVGQTTATEVTFGPMMGSQSWLKNFNKNPGAAMGPGEHNSIDMMLPFSQPQNSGFALAQGQTRDMEWPLKDFFAEINQLDRVKHIRPKIYHSYVFLRNQQG